MKKLANFTVFLVAFFATIIIVCCCVYNYQIGAVSKNSEEKEFKVEKGSTYSSLANALKEQKLIRSPFFYKLYIKIFKPSGLEACTYHLSENMGVKKIVEALSKSCNTNEEAFMVTIPEGKNLETVASILSENTNVSKEDLISYWDSTEFVDKVIKKYWFVTDTIKQTGIRHPLEGYLFPSTYELPNREVTPEYLAYRMLDQMEIVLKPYKEEIEKGKYSVHQLLTMASLVEYEAILDEDRSNVAGVFYNRLEDGMKLQSCATLGYAINEWKLTYSQSDMEVDSPYNTYYYDGLPIGPGGMPSAKSIVAALKPAKHQYYYFMANVCDKTSQKTYFSETYAEHQAKVDQYLTCF